MPVKYPITKPQLKQIAELEKNPFMTLAEIARRTGLSVGIVSPHTTVAHEGQRSRIQQAVQEYNSDPRKRLRDPRIWVFAHLYNLAPTHTANEILDILTRMRAEKKVPMGVVLPTTEQIKHIISTYRLRTTEQVRAIYARLKQKRKPNRLTRGDREKLLRASKDFVERIEKQLQRAYGSSAGFYVMEYVEKESRMVRIEPEWSEDKKIRTWMSFLKHGRKYVILNAVRRYKQAQKRESPPSVTLHDETARPANVVRENLDGATRQALSTIAKRNMEIFLQLASGEKARTIARRHGITPTRVNQIKRETAALVRGRRERFLRRGYG